MTHPREIIARVGLWLVDLSYRTNPFQAFGLEESEASDIRSKALTQALTTLERLRQSSLGGLNWSELLSDEDLEWIHDIGARLTIVNTKNRADWTHGLIIYGLAKGYNYLFSSGGAYVDFGTARGFSALVAARAMSSGGTDPRVVTFDILPHNTRQFWGSVDDIDGPKTRGEIWEDYYEARFLTFVQGPISVSSRLVHVSQIPVAFLDSAHTSDQVNKELDFVTARQVVGNIIIFDDFGSSVFSAVEKAAQTHSSRKKYIEETFETGSGKIVGIWRRIET